MNNLGLTLPLVKIDVARRLVIARAAAEEPDKANEIMDYASAKGQFEAWSNGYSERTKGLSKGNVRAMHKKDHASGRVDQLDFNDADKAFDVVMKIVDDNDWAKCLEGIYTGVSVGGGYLRKWTDPDNPALTRYTPVVRELSLVDDPCIPSARFAELVKMNGEVEQIKLNGVVRTFADAWAARPVEPDTFVKLWDGRPKMFAELAKTFDETKHARNHGKFSSGGSVGSPRATAPAVFDEHGAHVTNYSSQSSHQEPSRTGRSQATRSAGHGDYASTAPYALDDHGGKVYHSNGYPRATAPARVALNDLHTSAGQNVLRRIGSSGFRHGGKIGLAGAAVAAAGAACSAWSGAAKQNVRPR